MKNTELPFDFKKPYQQSISAGAVHENIPLDFAKSLEAVASSETYKGMNPIRMWNELNPTQKLAGAAVASLALLVGSMNYNPPVQEEPCQIYAASEPTYCMDDIITALQQNSN